MSDKTIFEKIRSWIGGLGFDVFLWSVKMTKEDFWKAQDEDARRAIGCCEHGKNGICKVCDATQTPPVRVEA